MKRHILLILAAAALPFGMAHADEADGSQLYRSGMTMASQTMQGQQAGVYKPMQAMPMQTTQMGAQAGWLTRDQVRAEAIQAMQQGTITRGEKGGFPQ
ncbi:MAG: DUF4148 domain-containing protein [Pseudomonadota bacterium]